MMLIIATFLLFVLCWFSCWCMDSVSFRWGQSPKWLRWIDRKLSFSWFGEHKERYWWIPEAFCDAWHWFKMILAGSIIALTSALITFLVVIGDHVTSWGAIWTQFGLWFIALSVVWNFLWYVFYDRRYKTNG